MICIINFCYNENINTYPRHVAITSTNQWIIIHQRWLIQYFSLCCIFVLISTIHFKVIIVRYNKHIYVCMCTIYLSYFTIIYICLLTRVTMILITALKLMRNLLLLKKEYCKMRSLHTCLSVNIDEVTQNAVINIWEK